MDWFLYDNGLHLERVKCHEKVLHNGVKQTLNELRNKFWINRGRNQIGNYSIYVLHVNAYICEVIVTLKNRIYQVTVLTVPFDFRFMVLIIYDLCLLKTFIIVVKMKCIKLTLFYLHVAPQEQLYLIWLNTVLVKTLLIVSKKYCKKRLSKEYCV